MKPVIALVGRANVGKSTLFNCLTGSRDALVADFPGLTRDRKYGEGSYDGQSFIVVDTGGISGEESGIDEPMAAQSLLAIEEADLVFLLMDARSGLLPGDEHLVTRLRSRQKPVLLVVNKIDGLDADVAVAEFYRLGISALCGVSAAHRRGINELMEEAFGQLGGADDGENPEDLENMAETMGETGIRIAVVGRPNVGKSTLVNRLLGEQRVVVYDQPGTTRDSITIPFERQGKPYTLIDTAGVRRRKHIDQAIEKFSIVQTLRAVQDANVVVFLVDGSEDLVDQDLHLLGFIINAGRSLVIAVNKWDGLESDQRVNIRKQIERRLGFADFADIHFISALHGTGVGLLYDSIDTSYRCAKKRWPASRLTHILESAVQEHQPPMSQGRRVKLRYAHQAGANPPRIVIHGNRTESLSATYKRYLENTFIRVLKLKGTPVRLEFKTGENPFSGKSNQLNQRQIQKKRRLMRHVKSRKR